MKRLSPESILLLIFLLGFSSESSAQSTGLSGFDLRLFRPPADGSGVLNVHGSEVLDQGRFHIGIVTDASHALLAATNPVTGQSIRVVNTMVTSNLQGALGITRFFQAGLNLPVIFFEQGTDFNTAQGFKTASVGDISLDLKFALLRDKGRRPGIALISTTTFPSGDTGKFTGDPQETEEIRLAADKTIGPLYLAANAGYRTVGRSQRANLDIDDMMTFGAGVAWTLPIAKRSMDLMGEVDGAHVFRASQELTTPVEWLVGCRKRFSHGMTAQVGGGRGITDGIGGGQWRVVAGLHWSPGISPRAEEEKEVLLETVYFRFDKDRFRPKYEPRLKTVAEKVKGKKGSLKLRGHTDREGTEAYNNDLSRRRAETVWQSLIRLGVPEGRMAIGALGSKEPASENQTKEGKSRNRRVEILKIP